MGILLRWRLPAVVLTAVPLALGATAATAATASAQEMPRLQPQSFVITMTAHSSTVYGSGPIHGTGTDTQKSNTLDVFAFRNGSVNVRHTSVANAKPKINYRTCTSTVSASGSWLITGGTNAYRHATGAGTFRFTEFTVLARNHKTGQCNLKAQPLSVTGRVTATGRAQA